VQITNNEFEIMWKLAWHNNATLYQIVI